MSSLRLLPNFSNRYPVTPSAEERRSAYIMLNGFHMYLPDNQDRESFSAFLSQNPVQPFLESRARLTEWTTKCINTCCRNDEDVIKQKREQEEARSNRDKQSMITISVLICGLALVYGAGKY